MDGSGDGTAFLGMDGFVVLATTEEDGELFVLVETVRRLVGCPDCGVIAVGHGRSEVQVRDLPMSGRPVRLVWRKRRRRCADPDCERQTFTEQSDLVEASLTTRAAKEICRRVGKTATPSPRRRGTSASDGGRRWERCAATARRSSRTRPASTA